MKKKAIIAYYAGTDKTSGEWGIYSTADTWKYMLEEIGSDLILFIPLEVSGSNYTERKSNIRDKAIEYSIEAVKLPWSYGELATIQSFFEKNARRYGLIKEFREEGII